MKKKVLIWFGAIALVALLLFGVNKYKAKENTKAFGLVGQSLPPFLLEDLNGNVIQLEDIHGKPMVLNLWFTTCKPCIAEIPSLNKIKNMYKDDVVFLAMTFNDPAAVKKFLDKHPFDFAIIPSAENYINELTASFPTTLFIDKSGKIRDVVMGAPMPKDENVEDLFIESFAKRIKLIL